MTAVFSALASASALLAGWSAAWVFLDNRLHEKRQKALKYAWQVGSVSQKSYQTGAVKALAGLLRFDMLHRDIALPRFLAPLLALSSAPLKQKLLLAGIGEIRPESAGLWRLRSAALAALGGFVGGLCFTTLAAVLGAIGGAALGWTFLPRALSTKAMLRKRSLERHISEAIEVMCLGLRAGLSFERSLELYCIHFPTALAHELSLARQVWNTGLQTREEALRNVAKTYDSRVFSRMVDTIIRSLRFGSPLASSLEGLAHEARRAHRAQVEEAVMKAPVKMMLPVGLLILPSMLLLVMGPIMLELVEGF